MVTSKQSQPGAPSPSTMSINQTSPLPNDTKRITAALNTGASAVDISQEAYRLCRINALLRADLKKARTKLRSSKQKQAMMEDASLRDAS